MAKRRIPLSSEPVPLNGDPAPPANAPPDVQPTEGSASGDSRTPVPAGSQEPAKETPLEQLVRLANAKADDEQLGTAVGNYVESTIPEGSEVTTRYNVLFLYDSGSLSEFDADQLYSAAQSLSEKKPILLVLHSPGGEIAPAYFISKICRAYSTGNFEVAVPRRAKSAATLICCGADAVHMGILSELGPIDPQIDRMPTLGLKNAIEHIADLVRKYPAASDMFAAYLSKSLRLPQLGYYERVAESAVQYAERLLDGRTSPLKKRANEVARELVYDYKDHGFVIDAKEAEAVFGPGMVKRDTPEYKFANAAHQALDLARRVVKIFGKKGMYLVGTLHGGCTFYQLKDG